MAVRAAGRAGSSRGPLVRRVHGGFSLVELLVTIVLAGIIFAAMVPLLNYVRATVSVTTPPRPDRPTRRR